MFHTFSPSNHYEVHEFSGEVINFIMARVRGKGVSILEKRNEIQRQSCNFQPLFKDIFNF
jgi:hypothetical protein